MSARKLSTVLCAGVAGFIAYQAFKQLQDKRRRRASRAHRRKPGFNNASFESLERNPQKFFQAVRMTRKNFQILVNLLEDRLMKVSIRRPVSIKCRIFLTLLYLAHGGDRKIYAERFHMAASTVGKIILETCNALWDELHPIYLSAPNSEDWQRIGQEFEVSCRLPNCLGAVGGKQIGITRPRKEENRVVQDSIALLAICDADYSFAYVDMGPYGSQSEEEELKRGFSEELEKHQQGMPASCTLPNSSTTFPFFFVGDAAFPLNKLLMRTFTGDNLSPKQVNFNRRISRSQAVAENSFGILASRWRVLRSQLCYTPVNAEVIIRATLVLHNFLCSQEPMYCPDSYADKYIGDVIVSGLWRQDVFQWNTLCDPVGNDASRDTCSLRDVFCDYLLENKNEN